MLVTERSVGPYPVREDSYPKGRDVFRLGA
jgi:hypothetical protein